MKNFTVVLSMRNFDRERDELVVGSLERRDRRLFGGTGFSLFDGTRDLFFDTTKPEIALRLRSNIRKALKKLHIRGKVRIYKDEE